MPTQASIRGSILCALAALAISGAVPPTASAVPYDVIASTSGSSARLPQQATLRVLRSSQELQDLWTSLGRTVDPPQVDFRRHTVIIYFAGLRPTTGYRLEAEGVEIRAGTMLLQLTESTPGACCGIALVSTSPAIMLSTIPWRGPVDVQVRREARPPCSGCSP